MFTWDEAGRFLAFLAKARQHFRLAQEHVNRGRVIACLNSRVGRVMATRHS